MCNKGMRPRHWEKMSNIAGFDLTPDSGTTLRKVLKLNLEQYMEEFEGISAAATKVNESVLQPRRGNRDSLRIIFRTQRLKHML